MACCVRNNDIIIYMESLKHYGLTHMIFIILDSLYNQGNDVHFQQNSTVADIYTTNSRLT